MPEPVIPDRDKLRLLFVPCETRAHLQAWVKQFLGISFPDATVSEESNCNPVDMMWAAYDRMRRNDMASWSRVMAYAGRGGFKTLAAAALEVMVVLHLGRNVAHMAAQIGQSEQAALYVKSFFRRRYLQDYVVGDNKESVDIVRYVHRATGDSIPQGAWKKLSPEKRVEYDIRENYIKIVPCTMQGANSKHTEFFVVDEVDVVAKQYVPAYFQAQNIPDPRAGLFPMTLLTSTRKSRIGLVQWEIDEAARKEASEKRVVLQLLHWNLMDVTAACEPDRHRPDLPRQVYYINDDLVKHVTKEEFDVMNPGVQKKWYPTEGFAGCRGCRLFSACKGRLATHQTSKSVLLKPIEFGIEKFNTAPTPEFITTEYLCRKPDATGLIYPRLNRDVHLKTPAQIAEMVTGDPYPETYSKSDLIALLKAKNAVFNAGMDFGFTHNFAVVTVAAFGAYVFILDCYAQAGLELDEKIVNCEYLKTVYGGPIIFGDPAYPSDIKTFRRKGFRMKDWDKGPGSVKAGIEIVRALLWSGRGTQRLFFLAGDPGVDLLYRHMEAYKFKMDATATPTEEPDEENDDEPDALRYVLMNTQGSKGALKDTGASAIRSEASKREPTLEEVRAGQRPGVQQDWMKSHIQQLTGQAPVGVGDSKEPGGRVKKGRFIFSQE